jgi:hypothetical protein
MTSIKPPDGRPSAVPPAGAGEAGSAERAGGPSFREALERAGGAVQAEGTAPAQTSVAADPVGELARAVRSGALSAEQAIERLVERAVAAVGGQLSAAQRSELNAVLHEALQSDPALRELRDAVK